MIKRALLALACVGVALLSTTPQAVAQQRPTASEWLEPKFKSMLGRCFGGNIADDRWRRQRGQPTGSFLPSLLTEDPHMSRVLNAPVIDLGASTLTTVFGRVYAQRSLDRLDATGAYMSRLPESYARTNDLVVAPGESSWRYMTTCGSALQAALNVNLRRPITLAEVEAALRADLQNKQDVRYEIVYGLFESPVARAFRAGSVWERDPRAAVHYAFSAWDWHGPREQVRDVGSAFLLSRFYGFAAYTGNESTQSLVSSARLSIGSGGSTSVVSGDVNNRTTNRLDTYNVVALGFDLPDAFIPMQTPQQLSELVSTAQVFEVVFGPNESYAAAPSEIPMIRGVASETVLQFSDAIPRDYCERAWEIPSQQGSSARATLQGDRGSWLASGPGGRSGCLFRTSVTFGSDRGQPITVSAVIRLTTAKGGHYFSLPLQPVTLRPTDQPSISFDRLRLAEMTRTESVQSSGTRESVTTVWRYYFRLDEGAGNAQTVRDVSVRVNELSLNEACGDVGNPSFDQVSALVEAGASQRWVVLTVTRVAGPADTSTSVRRSSECGLNGVIHLLVGPNRLDVPREFGSVVLSGVIDYRPRPAPAPAP